MPGDANGSPFIFGSTNLRNYFNNHLFAYYTPSNISHWGDPNYKTNHPTPGSGNYLTCNLPYYWGSQTGALDYGYPRRYNGSTQCYDTYSDATYTTYQTNTIYRPSQENQNSDLYKIHKFYEDYNPFNVSGVDVSSYSMYASDIKTYNQPWEIFLNSPITTIERVRGFRTFTWWSAKAMSTSGSNSLKTPSGNSFFNGNGGGKNLIFSYSIIHVFPGSDDTSLANTYSSKGVYLGELEKSEETSKNSTETKSKNGGNSEYDGDSIYNINFRTCCCDNILIAERENNNTNAFILTKISGTYPIHKNDLFTVIFKDGLNNDLGMQGKPMIFKSGSGANQTNLFDDDGIIVNNVACIYGNSEATGINMHLPAPIIGFTPRTGYSYDINQNGYNSLDDAVRSGVAHTFVFNKSAFTKYSDISYKYGNSSILANTFYNNGISSTVCGGMVLSYLPQAFSQDDFCCIYSAIKIGDFNDNANITSGFQGIQGITGYQGISGSATTGAQGIQGIKGNQGVQGIKGNQGIQGIKGNQGVQGIKGNQGIQGIRSYQGIQGIQGIRSYQGIQGIQGASGGGSSSSSSPLLKNVKFKKENNYYMYEQVSKLADSHSTGSCPILFNTIKFQIDAENSWIEDNILTNNGDLPSSGNTAWGIRFERIRNGRWKTININKKYDTYYHPNYTGYTKTKCTTISQTPVNAWNGIAGGAGTLSPGNAVTSRFYMIPMDAYGFNFNVYIRSGSSWMWIDTITDVDLWYIPLNSIHFTHSAIVFSDHTTHVFTLKSVNTKSLMDAVTFRDRGMYSLYRSYDEIMRWGSEYILNGNSYRFMYDNKRIYIGGQFNMDATYQLTTIPYTTYASGQGGYNNTNGVTVDTKITNRFSFRCRIGLCTFGNETPSVSYSPHTTSWVEFNDILGLTRFENSNFDTPVASVNPKYGTNSNIVFVRGKMSKGKVPC